MLIVALALVVSVQAAAVVEGFATSDKLWLRDVDGVVTMYKRSSGKSEVVAEHAVDMDRTPTGALVVLRVTETTGKQTTLELRDVAALATLTQKLVLDDDAPVAFIADSGPTTIVTTKTIMTVKPDGGEALNLTTRLAAGTTSATTTPDGVLIGFRDGGLYAITRATGLTREIKLAESESFGPVASVIADTTQPGCALVAVSAPAGYIARVCGTHAERIYAKPVSGLIASAKGWTAVGGAKLIRSKDGKVKESAQPKLSAWHGIDASFGKDAIVLEGKDQVLLVGAR